MPSERMEDNDTIITAGHRKILPLWYGSKVMMMATHSSRQRMRVLMATLPKNRNPPSQYRSSGGQRDAVAKEVLCSAYHVHHWMSHRSARQSHHGAGTDPGCWKQSRSEGRMDFQSWEQYNWIQRGFILNRSPRLDRSAVSSRSRSWTAWYSTAVN